jgi:hypothetical protein
MTDRELVQQALEALEDIFGKNKIDVGVINRLRDRLAQPEQEPVAWYHPKSSRVRFENPNSLLWTPLYTAPRQWQGLTDEDVDEIERWIAFKEDGSGRIPNQKLVRYIERKLKEKNT